MGYRPYLPTTYAETVRRALQKAVQKFRDPRRSALTGTMLGLRPTASRRTPLQGQADTAAGIISQIRRDYLDKRTQGLQKWAG